MKCADLLRPDQHADAEVVDARIVADDREIARAAIVQRLDEILGQARTGRSRRT